MTYLRTNTHLIFHKTHSSFPDSSRELYASAFFLLRVYYAGILTSVVSLSVAALVVSLRSSPEQQALAAGINAGILCPAGLATTRIVFNLRAYVASDYHGSAVGKTVLTTLSLPRFQPRNGVVSTTIRSVTFTFLSEDQD